MSDDAYVVEVFDLDSLGDVVADESVAKAGLRVITLPAGKYQMGIEKMEGRKFPSNAKKNPNRQFANVTFQDPDTKRRVYCDVSWEPGEDTDDKENKLYSQIELALGMTGDRVTDVLAEAKESTFTVELIETCRLEVGELPEDRQDYFLNVKGLGIGSETTVYLKPEEADLREFLLMNDHRIRNYVKNIYAGVE